MNSTVNPGRLTERNFQVLEPLGISLYKMETDDDGRKHSYGIYCAVAGLVIFGTVVLVGVLTITKKKLRYRDRNLIAASTWTPPKTDSSNEFSFPKL